MPTVTICFTLDSEDDLDLLRWLNGLPRGEKSAAIRRLLKMGLRHGGDKTLADVYQAVQDLNQKLGRRPLCLVRDGTFTVDLATDKERGTDGLA